jgi:hypothetical protein
MQCHVALLMACDFLIYKGYNEKDIYSFCFVFIRIGQFMQA